jgi:hypothetical protein
MENLDNIKDIWKNQGESSIRFTRNDIHSMVQKKSSSIVKWILIVSLLEFILPNLVFVFTDFEATRAFYQKYGLEFIMEFYTVFHVIIIIGFIYVFYKNYKNISSESNVKILLSNILKTRSTVKYYIYYNLTIMGIIGLHMFYVVYHSPQFLEELPINSSLTMVWIISITFLALALLVFWIFYRIIYGFFLKKLKKNYAELESNDQL